MNAQRKTRGEPEVSAPDFLKLSRIAAPAAAHRSGDAEAAAECRLLGRREEAAGNLPDADARAALHDPRRNGSGLDIDALKVVAEGVNALRGPTRGMLVITHYQRLLDYIKPDRVHVLSAGRIVKSGGPELALELEKSGYDQFLKAG
jgi:Fe-S cluster assembly ATP-binding protein